MSNLKHDNDAATAAIEIESLTKVYGRGATQVRAVDNISLSIPPGQILGLLGPNGAGKTTTIKLICGLVSRPAARCG